MKIESRVEVLENELKILKNEIQATLLEIREQVLNHYYPELRAEEPVRLPITPAKSSESREIRMNETRVNEIRTNEVRTAEVRPFKVAQSKMGNPPRGQAALPSMADQPMADQSIADKAKGQVQPFSDVFIQDMDGLNLDDIELDDIELDELEIPVAKWEDADKDAADDDLDEDEAAPARSASPQMREVGLQQLKQAGVAPKPRVKPGSAPVEPPSQKPNRRSFAALAAWVGNAVAKVGKERAIQVIETYAASGGPLPVETKGSLMQLIGLASDVELADVVGNQEVLSLMVELDQLLAD